MPDGLFVIEVKHKDLFSVPDYANLFIQCLTYKSATFEGKHPIAVFNYTNIDYNFFPETFDTRMQEVLFCTFGRINIGRIEIKGKDYSFIFYKGDTFFRYKNGQIKSARKDLLSISFGSGNNKLFVTY